MHLTVLQKILRYYGRTQVNDVFWVWDYANEKPMLEKKMTPAMKRASNKAQKALIEKQRDEDQQPRESDAN